MSSKATADQRDAGETRPLDRHLEGVERRPDGCEWRSRASTAIAWAAGSGSVGALYGLVAIGVLAPLASQTVLPAIPDVIGHVGAIVQARMALEEGQFPLRVAPWQHNGWRYPVFQFYGNTPYTIAALIYRYVTPGNPYTAYILTIWLSLTGAGICTYKTSLLILGSRAASVIAGASYLLSPYLLVNIHSRGAFTEIVGQAALALAVYGVVRCYLYARYSDVLLGAFAWFLLATTHAITFVYGSLFLGLWIALLWVTRIRDWRRVLPVGAAYALGLALAAYVLGPVIVTKGLRIYELLPDPYLANWVSPLPTLLSPASVPAEPQPGRALLPAHLNPAVGWLILGGWLTVVYYALTLDIRNTVGRVPASTFPWRFIGPLGLLFAGALFAAWSPVDFWQYLPQFLQITQFPYRLLAQAMWMGALLVGAATILLFGRRLDGRHLAMGLLIAGAMSSSYLPAEQSASVMLADVIRKPDIGYGQDAYLYRSTGNQVLGGQELALSWDDGWLILGTVQHLPEWLKGEHVLIRLDGAVPADWFPDGLTLRALLGRQEVGKVHLTGGAFQWEVPLDIKEAGEADGLSFESDATVEPRQLDPRSADERRLAVRVTSLTVEGLLPERTMLPVRVTRQAFRQEGPRTVGDVTVPPEARLVQLPVLFYPRLLDVRVDGMAVPYLPLRDRDYVLTGLRLEPGIHHISVRFVGLKYANLISAAAWLVVAISVLSLLMVWVWRSVGAGRKRLNQG